MTKQKLTGNLTNSSGTTAIPIQQHIQQGGCIHCCPCPCHGRQYFPPVWISTTTTPLGVTSASGASVMQAQARSCTHC